MFGPGDQDGAPALEVGGVFVAEVLELVHVFEVEVNRTLLAVHFETVLVFPAAGVARSFERAVRAVGEAREERADVLDFDAGRAAVRPLAVFDKNFGHAADTPHGAVEPEGGVNVVSGKVAGDARAGHVFLQAPRGCPAHGHFGRNRPVLEVSRPVVKDLPQPAFVNHLLRQADRGDAAVIEPDHIGLSGFFDGPRHLPRLRQVHGQGLFAKDHLAGGSRCERDFMVRIIRRADVNRIDVGSFYEFVPVALHALPSPSVCKLFCLLLVPGGNRLQHGLIGCIEKLIDAVVGVRMGPAHEAVTHHADSEFIGHRVSFRRPPRASGRPRRSRTSVPAGRGRPWRLR